MPKVVINVCFGGFGLSPKARSALAARKGTDDLPGDWDLARDDRDLVAIVEELGPEASDSLARLRVVEIPDDVEWEIDEYDGNEHVAEKHRTWT